jgi:hypothetical protein
MIWVILLVKNSDLEKNSIYKGTTSLKVWKEGPPNQGWLPLKEEVTFISLMGRRKMKMIQNAK